MTKLRLDKLRKEFGDLVAVNDLTLEIESGTFAALVGPSGCGKTTTLNMIAGIVEPTSGRILFDDVDVTKKSPRERNIGLVFQSYAVFSSMSTYDNLAWGLKVRKVPKDQIQEEVKRITESLQLEDVLDRKAGELSLEDTQKVALGRTLVTKPAILLLDEPLSNIHAALRGTTRVELKRLQRELGQTVVYVTHDQIEAMSMAEKIAVMRNGVLQQFDSTNGLYKRPANRFVANFIGSPTMNFIDCSLTVEGDRVYLDSGAFRVDATGLAEAIKEYASGSELILGVRPEHVYVWDKPRSEKDFQATVDLIEPLGNMTIIHFTVDSTSIKAVGSGGYLAKKGEKKWLSFDRGTIHVFDKKTEKAVL